MNAIYHIGHHKVGTTALQIFLAHNSYTLMKAGILYPKIEADGLIDFLSRAMRGGDELRLMEYQVCQPHNALAYRILGKEPGFEMSPLYKNVPGFMQIVRNVRTQIEALQPKHTIFCSEIFSNFGAVRPEMIDIAGTMVEESRMKLYCVLRRPDQYLASWHWQWLKFGRKSQALDAGGTEDYFDTIHFDYQKMLEPWLTSNIFKYQYIRPYSDVMAQGGVVQDFFDTCEIDLPETPFGEERLNVGVHVAFFEVLRTANHKFRFPKSKKLRIFIEEANASLDLPSKGDVELFGKDVRRAMYDRFRPIEQYLREVTGRAAFFEDLDNILDTRPLDEPPVRRDACTQLMALPAFDALDDKLRAHIAEHAGA
ncbi:hypothetical protein [Pseudaestuariivita sp.]|uniref:hypothetical protein n=1 Tax=Pseudaestuariivita sp. TaxID=2211669 RepID=UPI0040596D7D